MNNKPKYAIDDVVVYKTEMVSPEKVKIQVERAGLVVGVDYDPYVYTNGERQYEYRLYDNNCLFSRKEYELSVETNALP